MTKRKEELGSKVVGYMDEHGEETFSLIPQDAPLEDAPLGIPAQGTTIKLPSAYEPLRPVLERAYAERGIFSSEDIANDPQIEQKLRLAHQQVIRFTVIDILRANREE